MFKLADISEIPEGKSKTINLPNGDQIALFNLKGEIYALDNACPHMEGPLAEGEIEDCKVTCPWHGWQFDIKSGECENMPGQPAKKIPLIFKGQEIFLENLPEP